jgi:hypothetical protein
MSAKINTSPVSEEVPETISSRSTMPLRFSLRLGYLFSLLIALLTAVVAIAGILFPENIYPTAELQESFLANDVITILIGVPLLLASMWLARRGKLIGLLFWPGAVFFGLYNYIVYLFGMPFNVMFPLYLLIVTMSIYTTIVLVVAIDGGPVKERLSGKVPVRLGGGVLVGFGIFAWLWALGTMIGALVNQTSVPRPDLALHIADFIFAAAWVIGGILLWRRLALGYVGGTGLLFQASMLTIGLLILMILQPILGTAPFILGDFIFILLLSLITFIPFILFLRGVVKS